MALPEPTELLKNFNGLWLRLSSAEKPLSAPEQRKMAEDLSDVYNYLSFTTEEPSLQNILHSQSAHDALIKEQLNADRAQLDLHRSFIESSYEKVDQYLRTIQLAGYAAFFGLWSLSRGYLPEKHALYSLLLMVVSASIFMLWEILKSSIVAVFLKHHSNLAFNSLEYFISSRIGAKNKSTAILIITKYRVVPWFISIITGLSSITLLLALLVCRILNA